MRRARERLSDEMSARPRARALARRVRAGLRPPMHLLLRAVGGPVGGAVISLLQATGRPAGIALVLHRVGTPPGDPRLEVVPWLDEYAFAEQVRLVKRHFRLVAGSELPRASAARRRGERFPLALTFDDDHPSHLEHAAPVLLREHAPATFFLNGASLAGAHRFWWEALELAARRGVSAARVLEGVIDNPSNELHELAGQVHVLDAPRQDECLERLNDVLGPPGAGEGLDAEQVRRLAADFEIGFHTVQHRYLPRLSDDDLAAALGHGVAELGDVVGRRVDTIAYPHGAADDRVAAAARGAGFRYGYTTHAAAVTPRADPLLLSRVENSFHSTGHLAARLALAVARG